jgi:hypothetical protein
MADYGNATDLALLYTALADSVSSNLKTYALEVSTTWVNSKVEGLSTSSVPDLVEKAATFYAYSFILRNLFDVSESDTESAIKFEKMAEDLLGAYIAQQVIESSESHPYSSNLTPTGAYTGRNKRTVEDDTNYDNINEVEWESEE